MGFLSKRRTAGTASIEAVEVAKNEALSAVASSSFSLPGYADFATVARGGSSVVFRATELRLNRPVAVKVIPRHADEPGGAVRFNREKEIAALLGRHPYIVQVLDAGETPDGSAYLVMEYFENGSLADRLRNEGPFPIADALEISARIASALEAAHQADVLHRDVKPSNILLSQYGPALSDFGISRSMSRGEWTQTLEHFTPWHSAPEILEGDHPSAQTDVYSLASTVATIVTGRPPFAVSGDERPLAYQLRVLSDPLPGISRPDAPQALHSVLAKAMAKKPEDRFASAAEFGEAISRLTLPSRDRRTERVSDSEHDERSKEQLAADEQLWGRPTTESNPIVSSPTKPASDPQPTPHVIDAAGAIRPSVAAAVRGETIPRADNLNETTTVVRRQPVATRSEQTQPTKRSPWIVVAALGLFVGVVSGIAVALWPRKEQPVQSAPVTNLLVETVPVLGDGSPRNLSLVEKTADLGVKGTRLLVELRWQDGTTPVPIAYAYRFQNNVFTATQVESQDVRRAVFTDLDPIGSYCFGLVTEEITAPSGNRIRYRSEQTCLRDGVEFDFEQAAKNAARTSLPPPPAP